MGPQTPIRHDSDGAPDPHPPELRWGPGPPPARTRAGPQTPTRRDSVGPQTPPPGNRTLKGPPAMLYA